MKILCVCSHGNVRSVALAYQLKTIYNHEAIAIGAKEVSPKTFNMLEKWADKVIWLDKWPKEWKLNKKYSIVNVGEDVWHNPFSQELQHKLMKNLKYLNL